MYVCGSSCSLCRVAQEMRAARAYDHAAIQLRGQSHNFPLSDYLDEGGHYIAEDELAVS